MLQPKRLKFRKVQRGRRKGMTTGNNAVVSHGDFGLKALEVAWITARQIEAGRVTLTRHFRRGGKVWVRIFPDKPVTKKPAEVRMGGGKAAVDHWVAVVKPGRILYEVGGVQRELALEALRLASHKLPINCKVAYRDNFAELVN